MVCEAVPVIVTDDIQSLLKQEMLAARVTGALRRSTYRDRIKLEMGFVRQPNISLLRLIEIAERCVLLIAKYSDSDGVPQ